MGEALGYASGARLFASPYTTPIAMAAEAQAASDTPVRTAQSRTSPSRRRSTLIEPASIAGRPATAARLWKERLVGGDPRAEPVLGLFVVFSASIVTSPSPTTRLLDTREARMKQIAPDVKR